MRQPLTLALVCLFVLPVHAQDGRPNERTDEEIADGWVLLFDGKTASQWKIEGEYEIVDGVLILGGKADARAFFPLPSARDFEMHLQYRSVGPIDVIIGGGNGRYGISTTLLKAKKDWHDASLWEYWDPERPLKRCIASEHNVIAMHGSFDRVWIEARAGQRVYLRNIMVKHKSSGPWAWLIPLLVVAAVCAVVAGWRWRMKRQAKPVAREQHDAFQQT
jgi:hypothetical protein